MTVKQLLDAKREGQALASEDIRRLIAGYTAGDVPDYQMAAFAMAVCCRGMAADEIFALTDAMRLSGRCLEWSACTPLPTADKHSTGGVGDKLSMIVQPLAAACGVAVPSLTGRGLGHTGGTADKLESIPGYKADLSLDAFQRVVAACGVSMTVQTPEICPADRKLYALRDVTGTVPSIPLIVASILSKKLAEGAGTLVFDVKCGGGAFMRTREAARALARALVDGARAAGRQAAALVTRMDAPLGYAVGNALEIAEAYDVLCGADVPAVTELSIALAAEMVALARALPHAEACALCRARLADGSARARFDEMVRLHGGDLAAFAARPAAPVYEVRAPRDGYVAAIDARAVAEAALLLGAGRQTLSDTLDPLAGVVLAVQSGDRVAAGDVIARLATLTRADQFAAAADIVSGAFAWASEPPAAQPWLLERLA